MLLLYAVDLHLQPGIVVTVMHKAAVRKDAAFSSEAVGSLQSGETIEVVNVQTLGKSCLHPL